LREAFDGIENPNFDSTDARYAIKGRTGRHEVLRKIQNPDDRIV
jgi:hypothetical protein